jgi:transcriptional regulator with PAS, ATPase and Fis domain
MVDVDDLEWFEQLPCSVTVCDKKYTILYLNDKAAEVTSKEGGKALVGKNLMDCHPPRAQKKLKRVMTSGRPNVYTTERKGAKKLVYQCHWKKGGRVGGLVELSFELPSTVPNFVRT